MNDAPARVYVRLLREARVWGAQRPAGWHGYVLLEEYARLREEGVVAPVEAVAENPQPRRGRRVPPAEVVPPAQARSGAYFDEEDRAPTAPHFDEPDPLGS